LECGDLSPLFFSGVQDKGRKAATSRRTPKELCLFSAFSTPQEPAGVATCSGRLFRGWMFGGSGRDKIKMSGPGAGSA